MDGSSLTARVRSGGLILAVLACAACLALLIVEARTRSIRRFMDDVIYDNRSHYLPCEKLPEFSYVESVAAGHRDVIQQIEQINPGNVGVEIDATTCPGKADLLIWYGSHADRLSIEAILGADTFFGIPYRLQNR
jgi:hypothetical protein